MPVELDNAIVIKRPFSGATGPDGTGIEKPIDLQTITTRRNIQSVRVTYDLDVEMRDGRPVLDENGNPIQNLISLNLVIDVASREILVAKLNQFDGNRLDRFYEFVSKVSEVIDGTAESSELTFMSTDDFPP